MAKKLNEDVHVGDTPVLKFVVNDEGVIVDLTSATVSEVNIQKPDGTTMTKTLSVTEPTNGVAIYAFQSGEISTSGHWKAQGYIEMAGWKGYTEEVEFYVKPVIPRAT